MKHELSFKQFMELTAEKPATHLDVLRDELGINPEVLSQIPQMLANFKMGGDSYNIGSYKIVGFDRDDDGQITSVKISFTHDPVQSITHKRKYKTVDGKQVEAPDNDPDTGIKVIPIKLFNKMMTQGLDQPGGDMGMGGMPGGMPI